MTQLDCIATLVPTNPDFDLLRMIDRHTEVYDILSGDIDDDAELVAEMCDLEIRIAAKPAFTNLGVELKRKVVARAEFSDEVMDVVWEILRLDGERVMG